MYTVEVQIDLRNSGYSRDLEDTVDSLVSSWSRSGQVMGSPGGWVLTGEMLRFTVLCPEPDALAVELNTSYYRFRLQSIQLLTGVPLKWEVLGPDPRFIGYQFPSQSRWLILHGETELNALRDGDTFEAVPFYRFPEICDPQRGHDDLHFWKNQWDRMYGLWFNGSIWEKEAQRQLEEHDSELSQMGRAAAARVEKLTGIPTYYWLFNYREISHEEDVQRKCPETGAEWYIPGRKQGDYVAFKCEKSRLVSQLSSNSG